MSNFDQNNISGPHRFLGGIFLFALTAVLLILILGVYPARRRLDGLKLETRDVDLRIAELRERSGGYGLAARVAAARAANESMKREWRKLVRRTRTFKEGEMLSDILATTEEGRIDYKVALYDARQWVGYRARNNNVNFVPDLGMKETVGTDEVMESKLWQLAADVSLAEMIIASGVESVEKINMIEPSYHVFSVYGDKQMILYPIRLNMISSYPALIKFIGRLGRPDRFYVPQRIMIESMGPRQLDKLNVSVVCTAVLYKDWQLTEDFDEEDQGRDLTPKESLDTLPSEVFE